MRFKLINPVKSKMSVNNNSEICEVRCSCFPEHEMIISEVPEKYHESINQHYGRENLGKIILDGLRADGKDIDKLRYEDLSLVDQFHSKGKEATLELARLAKLSEGLRVLDLGGGLGGPARTLASEFGCTVTVLDLTEEYCNVGEMLTSRTGLDNLVSFKKGSMLNIPFRDESFDVVWSQHSTMNIANKDRLFDEIHRVLVPAGRLAMHEILEGPVKPIRYPVPWALDSNLNFLLPTQEMQELIANCGFKEIAWLDHSRESLDWFKERATASSTGTSTQVGLHLLLANSSREPFRNQVVNLQENRVVIVQALFECI